MGFIGFLKPNSTALCLVAFFQWNFIRIPVTRYGNDTCTLVRFYFTCCGCHVMTHAHAFSTRWPLTSTGMHATGVAQRCVAAATYVTEHVLHLSAKQLWQYDVESQAYVSVVSNRHTACGIQWCSLLMFACLYCYFVCFLSVMNAAVGSSFDAACGLLKSSMAV